LNRHATAESACYGNIVSFFFDEQGGSRRLRLPSAPMSPPMPRSGALGGEIALTPAAGAAPRKRVLASPRSDECLLDADAKLTVNSLITSN